VRSQLKAMLKSVAMATAALAATYFVTPAGAGDQVTQERLLNSDKEAGNWLQHHKNYSATRFSSLREINKSNVKNLKVAWTMHLGGVEGGGMWTHGGLEGTPIVENGMIYVTDGWGSVYKIDARGGKGTLLWKMDPKTDRDWAGAVACCGVDNRGFALWSNSVISHTLDGRMIATNKETGQVEWQRQIADPEKGETITAAPLIVKDMAISGVAGAELGIRGWIAATDDEPKGEVADLHHTREGGARQRNLEGRQERSGIGRRINLDNGQLRSCDRYHLLGHRQSWAQLGQPISPR